MTPRRNAPRASVPAPTIILEALAEFGYAPVAVSDDETDFRFEVFTESNRKWRAQIILSPPSQVVRFVVHCSSPYCAEQIRRVAELTQRLDEKIGCLGGFGFHWPTGSGFYRYAVDYEPFGVSVDGLTRQLNTCAWPVKVYRTAFEMLDKPKITPEKATDLALMLHGCPEQADRPHSVLKTLLKVEEGGGKGDGVARGRISLFDL